MEKFRILTINPGSTSTKIALYDDEELIFKEELTHEASKLEEYKTTSDQLPYRTEMVIEALKKHNIELSSIDAFSGRGGGLVSVKGGTYNVNDLLLEHARIGYTVQHASILGAQIAYNLAQKFGKRSFVVNPITVDEKEEVEKSKEILEELEYEVDDFNLMRIKDEEEAQEFRNFVQSIKPSDFERLLKDNGDSDS